MSIRDVAARAGVSAATVSRVFTQPDAVSLDTCGVSEVGSGPLTSSDRWLGMIPLCRCGSSI